MNTNTELEKGRRRWPSLVLWSQICVDWRSFAARVFVVQRCGDRCFAEGYSFGEKVPVGSGPLSVVSGQWLVTVRARCLCLRGDGEFSFFFVANTAHGILVDWAGGGAARL